MVPNQTKKTFSTFDVERILKIKRTRLQEWLDEDYIRPWKKAEGKGSKTIFSHDDLYRIQLFIYLLREGKERRVAAKACEKVNIDFSNVGRREGQFRYLCGISKVVDPNLLSLEIWSLRPDLRLKILDDKDIFISIVNLALIKESVDGLVS